MAEVNLSAQNRYLQQKIESASAIGRIIILYDACIRFLNEARDAFVRKDKVVAVEKIIRSQNIIRELRNALNMDLEPKIAGNMYRLYTYFLKRLMEANRGKELEPIDFVINQMTTLNNAWKEAETKGLGKDIKRYEERLGTNDTNIVRRVAPQATQQPTPKKGDGELLETLNVKI